MNALTISNLSPLKITPFDGISKPTPPNINLHEGLPYSLLCKQTESAASAFASDVSWLIEIIEYRHDSEPCPEWSGAMVQTARQFDEPQHHHTNFVFGPLIDSTPSHPDTVLTTLLYLEEFVRMKNIPYIHASADMQLYKVVMQIKWCNPARWKHLIIRPGGMHTIMSFIGCIGNLMCCTGLEEFLSAAFKGVENMLSGRAWPKALRGLRMVVEALLEPFIVAGGSTVDDLQLILQEACRS